MKKYPLLAKASIISATVLLTGCASLDSLTAEEPVSEETHQITEMEYRQQNNYKIREIDRLPYHTKRLDGEIVKAQQEQIKAVLASFEVLEKNLQGFQEREALIKLKNQFRNDYLLIQTDQLNIYRNLNKVKSSR